MTASWPPGLPRSLDYPRVPVGAILRGSARRWPNRIAYRFEDREMTVADTLEIVPHVAGVLLCVRLRQTRRDQLRSTQAALDRLPVPPVGVVLTDVREAAEGYYGYYGAPTAAGKA